MTDEEALMTIGLLVTEARQKHRDNRVQAAEKIGVAYKTMQNVEHGQRLPNKTTLTALEHFYGWSDGALMRIWDNRHTIEFGSVHAVDLRIKPEEIEVPMVKAKDLTTEELLAELNFRVLVMNRADLKEDFQ